MAKRRRPSFPTFRDNDLPPGTIPVAMLRVGSFLDHWRMLDFDLKRLMVSCYLQGFEDAANVAAKFPEVLNPPAAEHVPDFQI